MTNSFSKTISLLRRERGLSQKQAAAELGISQALMSHYENGVRECGLDFLVKISRYFDVSCDYLLGLTDNCSPAAGSGDAKPQPDNAQVAEALREISGKINSLIDEYQ